MESKYKSVKFLPFNMRLCKYESNGRFYWENGNDINDESEYLRFSEVTIFKNPNVFEVELAGREFEDGVFYFLYGEGYSNGYTIGWYSKYRDCFYIAGSDKPFREKDFNQIGVKIKRTT